MVQLYQGMASNFYPIRRLPINLTGRDFIVGDIHGTFDLLKRALADLHFDERNDRLFSVGDLIDRGRLSHQVLEFLQLPYVYAIRGNHEDMLLELYKAGEPSDAALQHVTSFNGLEWWRSVSAERRTAILAALRALPLVIELETARGSVGIVHAEVPVGMTWGQFCSHIEAGDPKVVNQALWGRSRIQSGDTNGVPGIGRLFVGHTPQHGGLNRYGNTYAIDTGAVFGVERGHAGFHLTVANLLTGTASLAEKREVGLLDLRSGIGSGSFGNYAVKQP